MRAILTYHSIDTSGSPISCHPDIFARHVAWLASGRVRVTSIDELLGLPDDTDAVALTFDDGFVNFGELAAPLLRENGLPVTLFVVSGRVGQTNSWDDVPARSTPHLPLLDWPALGRLQEQGVILGAHSMTHRSLPTLTADELETEVQGCAEQIESHAGRRPTAFAYPYGHRDNASTRVVARAFSWACTTEYQPISLSAPPCALPRLDMGYFSETRSLDAWGTRWFRTRMNVRHTLRQVRQMAVRRVG